MPFDEENFMQYNQNLNMPNSKLNSPLQIDLTKIVTLSALVEPDANIVKLKDTIERLKYQVVGQQKEILALQIGRTPCSCSISLMEQMNEATNLNVELQSKVTKLSNQILDYETLISHTKHEYEKILETQSQTNKENNLLKLQIDELTRINEKQRCARKVLDEFEKEKLFGELIDLKLQVNNARDRVDKSLGSLNVTSNATIRSKYRPPTRLGSNTCSYSDDPHYRPKKMCGRIIASSLNPKYRTFKAQPNNGSEKIQRLSHLSQSTGTINGSAKSSIKSYIMEDEDLENHVSCVADKNSEKEINHAANEIQLSTPHNISISSFITESFMTCKDNNAQSLPTQSILDIQERKIVASARRKLDVIKESSKSDVEYTAIESVVGKITKF